MASLKPDFNLQANSQEVTQQLFNRITSIEVNLDAGMYADQCVLQLDDRDNAFTLPGEGQNLSIALGYEGDELASVGEFEVAECSHFGTRDRIEIVANSGLWSQSFKAPRQHSWPSDSKSPFTLGQLVDEVAKSHKFVAKVSSTAASIVLPHLDQNESDMQLLQSLANIYDLLVRPVDNKLLVMEKGSGLSRTGAKLPQVAIRRQDLMQWQFVTQKRSLYRSCKAWYHDLTLARRELVSAGSGAPCYELHKVYADANTATLVASAKLKALQRSEQALELLLRGRTDIQPGQFVNLSEVRTDIDKQWAVSRVRHVFDKQGFITRLACERVI